MTAGQSAPELIDDLGTIIDGEIENHISGLTDARRHLHKHPELAWKEFDTMAFLSAELKSSRIEHRTGIAGTGIIVDIDGRRPGPCTAYRTDMDAVPLTDGKNVPYASVNPGVMHACGHDFHMAAALGVARIASRLKSRLQGSVRVFFQPAEEVLPAGSASMIDAGVMEGVSAIYAVHCEPALPCNHIGLRYGSVTASADMFELLIKGRSGHSSRPFLAVDAILIATKVVEAIYQLASQRTDPLEGAVINVGRITGGDAPNVICGHVKITGAIRCFDPLLRQQLPVWLEEMVIGIVRGMGGGYELLIRSGSPPLVNDSALIDLMREAGEDVVGPDAITIFERPSMGGEDFSLYAKYAPAALIRVGTNGPGFEAQLHNEMYDAGDGAFETVLRVVLRAIFARNAAGVVSSNN